MATYVQANQLMRLTTPLGPENLLITQFSGTDGMSTPFRYTVDASAPLEAPVDGKGAILGKAVTVTIVLHDSKAERHFHGIVSRFAQTGRDLNFLHYRMEVVPKFWLATLKTNLRIFQRLTTLEIVKKVLQEHQVDLRDSCDGSFPKREYCVQYRESDFNFVSRLLEEEGIFYYFEHEKSKHTLVLSNTPSGVKPLAGGHEFSMMVREGVGAREDEVFDFQYEDAITSATVALRDHHFELPGKSLEASKGAVDAKDAKLEIYDYPGGYSRLFDGINAGGGEQPAEPQKVFEQNKRYANLQMQEREQMRAVAQGTSNIRSFTAGYRFSLKLHPTRALNQEYQLVQVTHDARIGNYRSESGGAFEYSNSFVALPVSTPYRPPRTALRPTVRGTQTATVVGPAGEEIFTDKFSRVKVQFHWDREGKLDPQSSRWVRVATLWAGKQWGMIHIPRIGQEVVVDFLEGDPDQPIIVGSVYNADMMPPWKLPDNKTMSGVVSRSSLKGTPENYNELCFEDKKGEELVYLRAEKNLTVAVENDRTKWVGHDNWEEVDNQEDITIGADRNKHVKGNETTKVDGNRTETVGKTAGAGDETITINGKRTEKVYNNEELTVEMGNQKIQLKMGNRDVILDMGNQKTEIKMGNDTTKLNLGKSETEALQSIELKVGQSSLKVDQTGVTIKGMTITIEGQIMTEVKGLMTNVNASAILTLKGGLTMIN